MFWDKWFEPSINDLVRLVGLTTFQQYMLCALWFVTTILVVHCLNTMEDKPRWLDDLVVHFVYLMMVCVPLYIMKPINIDFGIESEWISRLMYFFGACLAYYDLKRLGWKPETAFATLQSMKKLLPTETKSTLGDRLFELAPLICLILAIVVLNYFLYDKWFMIVLVIALIFLANDIYKYEKARGKI